MRWALFSILALAALAWGHSYDVCDPHHERQGEQCVDVAGEPDPVPAPDPAPTAELYPLGPLPAFLSTLEWPQPPDEGNVIVLEGAINGGFVADCIGCTYDATNATINGTLSITGSRLRIVNATLNGRISARGATDVAIIGMRQTAPHEHNDFSGIVNRVAIVSSDLIKPANTNHDGWLYYSSPGDRDYNVILADVRIENDGGQSVRFQKITNLVIVDSSLNANNTASNGIRIHCQSRNVLIRDTQIVGGAVREWGESSDHCPWPNVQTGRAERVTWADNLSDPFWTFDLSENFEIIDPNIINPIQALDPGTAGTR